MNATMYITMVSVLIGFLFMGATFAGAYYKWDKSKLIAMFCVAIVFLTFIPVGLAIFAAT